MDTPHPLEYPDLKIGEIVNLQCEIMWRGNTGAYLKIITEKYVGQQIIYAPLDSITKP